MSAKDNMQYKQLQMFMPAGEIRRNYPTVDAGIDYLDAEDRNEESYASQLNESEMTYKLGRAQSEIRAYGHQESLYSNIQRRGIENPVALHSYVGGVPHPQWADGWLGNGGHRVAAQADIDPRAEVPVVHTEEFHKAGQDYHGWGDKSVMKRHKALPTP